MPKLQLADAEINYYLDDFVEPWVGSETVPLVLMHHGFARNLKWWTRWVPTLAGKCRVLRYDARGHGESSVPQPGYAITVKKLAGDALSIIEKLGIERIHWVGTYAGGLVGQVFAVTYPDRIKSLTLCNSPIRITDTLKRQTYSVGEADTAVAIDKLGVREWRARTVSASMDLSKADPKLVNWTINEMGKTPKHIATSWTQDIEAGDMTNRLSEINVPTLIMVGDRSRLVPREMLRVMQERLPDSRLCVFPSVSDGVDLIMPERCAQEALTFITQVN